MQKSMKVIHEYSKFFTVPAINNQKVQMIQVYKEGTNHNASTTCIACSRKTEVYKLVKCITKKKCNSSGSKYLNL